MRPCSAWSNSGNLTLPQADICTAPEIDGVRLVKQAKLLHPDLHVVMATVYASEAKEAASSVRKVAGEPGVGTSPVQRVKAALP